MASWNQGTPTERVDSIVPTEFITCSICEELYDDSNHQAKFLTCYHTFCSHCLTEHSKRQDNLGYIPCPNCRYHTPIPQDGVAGLQRNFYIDGVKEITKKIEQQIEDSCRKHRNQPMSFFCETCKQAICRDCTVLGHTKADGHVISEISDAEVVHRQVLLDHINSDLVSLSQIQSSMKQLELEMALLTAAKETIKEEVEQFIQLAHKKLEERQNQLMQSNEEQFNAMQNNLLGKQQPLQQVIDMLTKNIKRAEKLLKNGTLNEVIAINQTLMSNAKDVLSDFAKLNLGKNHITFNSDKGIDTFDKNLSELAEINVEGFLPGTFEVKCANATAGLKAEMQVKLFSHQGEQVPSTSNHFTIKITDSKDTNITSVLTTTEQGYTVTFTPQMSGPHKVSGMFLGQQLINEQKQISVSSNNPVLTFGVKGNGNGTISRPWGIAIDNNNCLYVADSDNRLIQKFTAEGEFLNQISLPVDDNYYTTLDMALDLNKELLFCMRILVEDNSFSDGNNILAFNLKGDLQYTYIARNVSNAPFIAMNTRGEFIVSDLTKHCLSKLDKKGDFLSHIGNLKYPGYITITDDDSIIVPDKDADCVYIFNPDGTIKHKFGTSGTGKGQLKQPLGIANDGEYILVCEELNNRIQVFKHDGTIVSIIESSNDPLFFPSGLAVTKDGHVYVVDTMHHCIKKFRYKDLPK